MKWNLEKRCTPTIMNDIVENENFLKFLRHFLRFGCKKVLFFFSRGEFSFICFPFILISFEKLSSFENEAKCELGRDRKLRYEF